MSPQICRNATVAFEMLLDLIKIFGPVIHSTLSASSLFGVELQAEQRSKIISLMRGAMLWITWRLSRRSGGEYGAHNHQFITMKRKKWYSFAMLDFGSRRSSAINGRYSRCHHSFAVTQASDKEARNGGGRITICRRGERHTYPLMIEITTVGPIDARCTLRCFRKIDP
ncbi:uncharacterized protein [Triticum aestivum]|uniref:uncharacterized protein n=1 Tax=Triticum aestivum TaxID=4565 RepID=UPI001D02BD01|nr:uncharacterized protein LOC123139595 [Triticum aestivum]